MVAHGVRAVVALWARGPGGCSYGICFAVSLYPGTAIPHTSKIRRSYTRKLYGNLTSGGQSPCGNRRARTWRGYAYDRACNGRSAPRVPSRGRGEDPELQQTYSKSQIHHTVSLRGPTCNHHFCARSELRPSTVLCCGAGPCRSRWVQPRPDPARLVSPLYSSAPHEPARRPSHASLLGAHRAHPRSRRVKEL